MFSRLRQAINRAGIYLIDDLSLYWHLIAFVVIVLVFAVLYTLLTPSGHGIGSNRTPLPDASFLTGLYFSVVTISSLGYSYMHPVGWSKALASFQVLIGLVAVGIMIAKVTSRRWSHYVSRLFSSDAQTRLKKVAKEFEVVSSSLAEVMPVLGRAYSGVPGRPPETTDDSAKAVAGLRGLITDLRAHCIELHEYLSREVVQGRFFDIVPPTTVTQLAQSVERTFFILAQLIASLSNQARMEVFDDRTRREIADARDAQQRVCSLVADAARDAEILRLFASIDEICEHLPASYFALPEEQQPDQILQKGNNDPQSTSEGSS